MGGREDWIYFAEATIDVDERVTHACRCSSQCDLGQPYTTQRHMPELGGVQSSAVAPQVESDALQSRHSQSERLAFVTVSIQLGKLSLVALHRGFDGLN